MANQTGRQAPKLTAAPAGVEVIRQQYFRLQFLRCSSAARGQVGRMIC